MSLRDNNHCGQCLKPLQYPEGPYCTDCTNEILKGLSVHINWGTDWSGDEPKQLPPSDNPETLEAMKQIILAAHKAMQDGTLPKPRPRKCAVVTCGAPAQPGSIYCGAHGVPFGR